MSQFTNTRATILWRRAIILAITSLLLAACSSQAAAQDLVITPSRADGLYNGGASVVWKIVRGEGVVTSDCRYTVKANNAAIVLSGKLELASGGYPDFPVDRPAVASAARYFDAVNSASRVRVPSLVAMGFVDTVAPPAGIWTAFNQIPAPKEAVPMVDSPHTHLATPKQQGPWTSRSAEWLAALRRGQPVPPPAADPKQ